MKGGKRAEKRQSAVNVWNAVCIRKKKLSTVRTKGVLCIVTGYTDKLTQKNAVKRMYYGISTNGPNKGGQ